MAWGLTWTEQLLDLLLPRVCVECREDLPPPSAGPLCGGCFKTLRPLRGPSCARCSAPWEGPESCCPACRCALFHVDLIRAAFPYRRPLPSLLYAFKYRGNRGVGLSLGDWMAGALARSPELRAADALVPVPLHPCRQRERGFNQARLLADRLARTGIPVIEALTRKKNVPAQWRFSRRARAERLMDAFVPSQRAALHGKNLLLIDDVCTTGGTLEGCARALREAGAKSVAAFVLARG